MWSCRTRPWGKNPLTVEHRMGGIISFGKSKDICNQGHIHEIVKKSGEYPCKGADDAATLDANTE